MEAARQAYEEGEWGKMNARDRGRLLFRYVKLFKIISFRTSDWEFPKLGILDKCVYCCRLADLMEEHKEELATIESIDSGAVYTLALKTHVGMSIETWRYFAGWCDKIQGSTIPVNNARPNRNLTFTKREPLGYGAFIIMQTKKS